MSLIRGEQITGNVASASYSMTASYVNPLTQDVLITGSLIFNEGARITPNYYGNVYPGYIDIVAGNGGFVELLSYNSQSAFWVEDTGVYLITSASHGWSFNNDGTTSMPGGVTAPSFTGSLNGVSDTANFSLTASLAYGANLAQQSILASYATSAGNAKTASYYSGSIASSSFANTASFVQNAQTASYVLNAISSSYAISASWAPMQNIDTSSLVTTTTFNAFTSSYNTGSFTGSFTGALTGTASYAISSSKSVSASYATNAGYAANAGLVVTQNSSTNQDYSLVFVTAGSNGYLQTYTDPVSGILYNPSTGKLTLKSVSASLGITGSLNGIASTASFVQTAQTASYVVSSSYANTASYVQNSQTASYVLNSISSSYSATASYYGGTVISSSYALNSTTASYSNNSTSASYALSASWAPTQAINTSSLVTTASFNAFTASYNTGSFTGSFIGSHTGSLFGTASYTISSSQAQTAATASYVLNSVSSSFASTASFVAGSIFTNNNSAASASYAVTASYVNIAISSSNALTASYVNPLIQTLQLTGSFNVTGSTTQIGNNTLYGNTTLSGSIIMSGSTTGPATPTIKVYGDMETNGVIKFVPVVKNIDNSISASYIYVSGSTQDLYFSQNGVGFSNVTRLRWIEGNLYSGLLSGGIISASLGTNTYYISSGSGIIVNLNATTASRDPYPTIQYLQWNQLSKTIDALSASFDQQFVAINSSNVIEAQGVPYTDGDFNTKIPIGVVVHQNHTNINAFQTFPSTGYGWKQRTSDFIKAFGPLKISGYTLAPSGSSTGSLVLGGGTAWVDGRNYTIDPNNPSYISEPTGLTVSKIYRYYQSGSGANNWVYDTNSGAGYATIDPSKYSNNGTLAAVANNRWSIQRVYYFPNSATKAFYVYYGNAIYTSQALALAAVDTELFTEAPNTAANAIYVGYMILRGNAVFTDAASFTIYQAGLFRGSGAGGSTGGTTTPGGSTGQIQYNNAGAFGGVTNLIWDGSILTATGSFTGSLIGQLIGSSSYATTASYVLQAISSSYAATAVTSSYILNAVSSSYSTTASYSITSSYVTGSVHNSTNPALSSSYALTSSYATITEQIGVTFDGQSSNISSTSTGYYRTTYPFTITNYYIDVNNSGSIQFDLRVNGTSIVVPGGNLPTLTSAPSSSAAIASWATSSLTAGTLIQYVITGSAPTVTWSKLTLAIKRT
jgi:hypothetical protein